MPFSEFALAMGFDKVGRYEPARHSNSVSVANAYEMDIMLPAIPIGKLACVEIKGDLAAMVPVSFKFVQLVSVSVGPTDDFINTLEWFVCLEVISQVSMD